MKTVNKVVTAVSVLVLVLLSTYVLQLWNINVVTNITSANNDSNLTLGMPTKAVGYNISDSQQATDVYEDSNVSMELWQLRPNLWGLTSGNGQTTINYTGHGLVTINVNMTNTTGYVSSPNLHYGKWSQSNDTTGQIPKFPIQLNVLSYLIVDVNYSLQSTTSYNGDISYDLYYKNTTSEQGNWNYETMIWLYRQNILPYGSMENVIYIPVTVNGISKVLPFEVWVGGNQFTGNDSVIIFKLSDNYTIASGDVLLDMSQFIAYSEIRLNIPTSDYIPFIELMSEFEANSTTNNGNPNYTLSIYKFSITPSGRVSPFTTYQSILLRSFFYTITKKLGL